MTDHRPEFGELAPEPTPHHQRRPSTGARVMAYILTVALLLAIIAVITPFIIALWRWAFAQ